MGSISFLKCNVWHSNKALYCLPITTHHWELFIKFCGSLGNIFFLPKYVLYNFLLKSKTYLWGIWKNTLSYINKKMKVTYNPIT